MVGAKEACLHFCANFEVVYGYAGPIVALILLSCYWVPLRVVLLGVQGGPAYDSHGVEFPISLGFDRGHFIQ